MLTPWEYKNKIIELEKKKNYREASEVLKMALEVYPTNLFFLGNEVYLLYRLNKIKEARQKAEERVELLKNDTFFLRTYLRILEKFDAKVDIEEVLERNIFSRSVGDENFYIFISQLMERVFSREKAVNTIKRALAIFQNSEALKELLAKFEKEEGVGSRYKYYKEKFKGKKIEDVIKEIESIRVLPNYANDYELLIYLAELYKKQGKYDLAIKLYKHLLGLKDNEFARKMLGYAYYKSDEFENALMYLKDIFLKTPYDHFLYSTIYKIFKEKQDVEGLNRLVNEALCINPDAKHLYGLLARIEKWQKGQKSDD